MNRAYTQIMTTKKIDSLTTTIEVTAWRKEEL